MAEPALYTDAQIQLALEQKLERFHVAPRLRHRVAPGIEAMALDEVAARARVPAQEVLDPGGQAGDVLMEPTRESFEENLLFCYKDHIKLEFSGLMASSKNAGILGAAALADRA